PAGHAGRLPGPAFGPAGQRPGLSGWPAGTVRLRPAGRAAPPGPAARSGGTV
ncbi:hypothetical protein KXX11_003571, partial [Aspergillus fumigatus]